MPEVRNREGRPRVNLVIGAKSEQGSRTGRCGWNTSFLERCCREKSWLVVFLLDLVYYSLLLRYREKEEAGLID